MNGYHVLVLNINESC